MKEADSKTVENAGAVAAASAPPAATMVDGADDTRKYVVLVPFRYKGKDRAVGDKVEFTVVQAQHLKDRLFVREPQEGE